MITYIMITMNPNGKSEASIFGACLSWCLPPTVTSRIRKCAGKKLAHFSFKDRGLSHLSLHLVCASGLRNLALCFYFSYFTFLDPVPAGHVLTPLYNTSSNLCIYYSILFQYILISSNLCALEKKTCGSIYAFGVTGENPQMNDAWIILVNDSQKPGPWLLIRCRFRSLSYKPCCPETLSIQHFVDA